MGTIYSSIINLFIVAVIKTLKQNFTIAFVVFAILISKNTSAQINQARIKEAFNYSKKNGLDTAVAIFIDFSIHSGKNRFFVYNFANKKILFSGLCAHGSGKGSTASKPVFSNEIGSKCSSLGKYKVKNRAYSNWGINVHYKMYGLEKTNSNAFKRYIVLHSYTPVPSVEVYPFPMFGPSDGCPVLANKTMRKVDALFKNKTKGVLLWIYI